MNRKIAAGWLVCGLLLAGCGEGKVESPEKIALDKVPAKIMDIARKEWPGLEYEQAYLGKFQGETAYKIRGRDDDGKLREVEISAEGKVLEKE